MGRGRKKKQPRTKLYRVFVSDIHSNIDVLRKLDELPELQQEGSLIVFCGDYIDGYSQDKNAGLEVLRYVKDKVNAGKAVALMGNHDQWLWEVVRNQRMSQVENAIIDWSGNGMAETLSSWGFDPDDVRDLGELLKQSSYSDVYDWIMETDLPYYVDVGYKNADDYIDINLYAVHAGFNLDVSVKDQNIEDMLWIRESYIEKPQYLQYNAHSDFFNSTIVSGHTPNQLFSEDMTGIPDDPNIIRDLSPLNALERYFIDAGSKGKSTGQEQLNVLILDDERNFIRSELLNKN